MATCHMGWRPKIAARAKSGLGLVRSQREGCERKLRSGKSVQPIPGQPTVINSGGKNKLPRHEARARLKHAHPEVGKRWGP